MLTEDWIGVEVSGIAVQRDEHVRAVSIGEDGQVGPSTSINSGRVYR